MSATPRTDALIKPDEQDMVVLFNEMLDHARQLERELKDESLHLRLRTEFAEGLAHRNDRLERENTELKRQIEEMRRKVRW